MLLGLWVLLAIFVDAGGEEVMTETRAGPPYAGTFPDVTGHSCCQAVNIINIDSMNLQSINSGTFLALNGLEKEGLPIYHNDCGQYLFRQYGYWAVGSDYNTNSLGIYTA